MLPARHDDDDDDDDFRFLAFVVFVRLVEAELC